MLGRRVVRCVVAVRGGWVQGRACSEPAWAAEARRKYEEEARRKAARKAQVEKVDMAQDDDMPVEVEDASDELPVVEEDGWLLWQSHDSFSADATVQWNPSNDDTAGGGIRSVEEAKFHCIKNGYGGFTQKWSLIYYFKANVPRRLIAGRQHVKKEDRGMMHLYVAPSFEGVQSLSPELQTRLTEAIANGTAPVKKDIEDELGNEWDDDWNEDDVKEVQNAIDKKGTDVEKGLRADPSLMPEGMEDLRDPFMPTEALKASEAQAPSTIPRHVPEADKTPVVPPEPKQGNSDMSIFNMFNKVARKELDTGRKKKSRKPKTRTSPSNPTPTPHQAKPEPTPQVKFEPTPQVQPEPAPPTPQVKPEPTSDNLLPVGSAVSAVLDITVKGEVAIPTGTLGVVKGHPKPGRMHIEFSKRNGNKNPNLNVTMKEVSLQ